MDTLITASTRVLRDQANAEQLFAIADGLASGRSEVASLSAADRLGILDFPDPEQREVNIASASRLSRSELLERAVESPEELTDLELKLLRKRYWLDMTDGEEAEQSEAQWALLRMGGEYCTHVKEQLERVRSSLYEANEERALRNAMPEFVRRGREASKKRQLEQMQTTLRRAQPWVGRLWEEGHAQSSWGFAVFMHPNAVESEMELDEYACRRDAALWWAREAVGCNGMIGRQWRLQFLDWPEDDHEHASTVEATGSSNADSAVAKQEESSPDDESTHKLVQTRDGDLVRVPISRPFDPSERHATDDMAKLESDMVELRKRFRALCAEKHSIEPKEGLGSGKETGLEDGILRNVFLLVTRPCVEAVLDGYVDHEWVYAIEPDYEAPPSSGEAASSGYRGHLPVRLQQLVNNFFDLRKFHEDEYSLEQLWAVAQRSYKRIFVSVKEGEMGLVTMSRDTGSALRPPEGTKIIDDADIL